MKPSKKDPTASPAVGSFLSPPLLAKSNAESEEKKDPEHIAPGP